MGPAASAWDGAAVAVPLAPAYSSRDVWCLLKANANKKCCCMFGEALVFFSLPGINEESYSVFLDFYFFGSCNESALMEKSCGIKQEIKSIWFRRNIIGFCRDCS